MQSAYEHYNNKIGVRLSYLLSDMDRCTDNSLAVMSYTAYKSKVDRCKDFKLRAGLGPGNEVLIAWDRMPDDWQKQCIARFGNPMPETSPMGRFFTMDAEAKRYYDQFQFEGSGEYLTPAQKKRYSINASVLNALKALKINREGQRRSKNGSLKGLWRSLTQDTLLFNDYLKSKHNIQHTLPNNQRSLARRFNAYLKCSYDALIDGRNNNTNAQVVTPEMIKLWKDIFAGQKNHKPTYFEVSVKYNQFLAGQADIINNLTGEVYDHTAECYRAASEGTVYSYQELWENRAVTHSLRSGDRQKFKGIYEPYHKLKQPEFAGSIISVDDRQPPFEYAPGKRMWFYNAIDLGSEAFTCWVYGETKEGIILDFYKQLVKNYAEFKVPMPHELEGEASLNSSFTSTFLENGAMFQRVRIEANNARGKKIESFYKKLRYGLEKLRMGWLARPFALAESNQAHNGKKEYLTKREIIEGCLIDIQTWNNSLHSDQELHPGMTRWDVFMDKQHPNLVATNWAGILPHLGESQKSTMKAGRIELQGKHRVVGFDGKVALGETLIAVMKRIEGQRVMIKWMEDNDGDVLKSFVYDLKDGSLICELLSDLEYSRATLEQTDSDLENRTLTSAYAATVQGYIRRNAAEIERITIIDRPQPVSTRFKMPGVKRYIPNGEPAGALEVAQVDDVEVMEKKATYRLDTASRF
ncbi:hypothetical protein [Mucilaginibacter sp.]|uniref:hypothetical protein n=1 Tax=Mucilaginibacter sp. TaxID=1882438 RepID=UPI0032660655